MIAGTISLYNYNEELMDSQRYRWNSDRKKIIKDWKKVYGEGYNHCFLQISPDTNMFPLTNKDGTNKKHS